LALAAGFRDGTNPTTVVNALSRKLAALAREPDGKTGTVGMIFATAHAEDLQICALLKRTLAEMGWDAVFSPPTGPRLRGDTLAIGPSPIRALYRYFPTEYMEGQENLGDITAAVGEGLVRTVPSFSQMYSQSKLSMARALSQKGRLSAEHQEAISRYLPET